MDRKLKDMLKPEEPAMLDAVCASAHQIWQAGLGAFARAQAEGGDLFDKLVQEGGELQKLTQRLSGDKGLSVTDTVARLAENAGRQASGSLDKLEHIFEQRVSRSLRSLGVPSSVEVQALGRDMAELKEALRAVGKQSRDSIDALQHAIARLEAATGTAAKKSPVAKKAAAKAAARPAAKAPAKRAAVKRPAAKKAARSAAGAG